MEEEKHTLSDDQKIELRMKLSTFSSKLLGIKYVYGSEWNNTNEIPEELDCSELVEGVYKHFGLKMPDGSQNQFNFTSPTHKPLDADLAFFGRGGGNPSKIYHVGLVYGEHILEARGFQENTSFETGKVILRPKENWIKYKNFAGFRRHAKLI